MKPIIIHPRAQVIITGKSLTTTQVQEVRPYLEQMTVECWCDLDGSIGHLDSVKPNTTYEKFYGDLLELTRRFSFLDLGVSVMNGPPGTFTQPLVSFTIKNNHLKRDQFAHFGHPPPKRVKKL